MFNNASGLSASDVLSLTNRNDGFADGNGWIWLIILALVFGWGNGGFGGFGGGSVGNNYILNSDFATIQRQLSDGFNAVDNALDRQNAGICDLGYTSLSLNNQTNTNMLQGFNSIQSQLADCCCTQRAEIKDTQYALATTGANIQSAIKDCCCAEKEQINDLKYTMATENCATRQAITDGTKQIIDYIAQRDAQNLRDENFALKLASSQEHQNNVLINTLRPVPVPSFPVPSPFYYGNNGFFGTTIA